MKPSKVLYMTFKTTDTVTMRDFTPMIVKESVCRVAAGLIYLILLSLMSKVIAYCCLKHNVVQRFVTVIMYSTSPSFYASTT
jgi:hypothetical protein